VHAAQKQRLRDRIAPERTFESLLDFPTYFEIETVNACNARCPMCTIDDWQRHTPVMKDALFDKIAAEICEHADTVKRVALYRDGEPLLDKRLPKRIKRLKGGGIKNVGISTNVELLNEQTSIALLDSGLDEIILSIDSLKKDVFEAIRVRLNFETVMENALRFIRLRNQIRPETSIWVRMIKQESNAGEWRDFWNYWSPLLRSQDRCYSLGIHNWGGQLDVKSEAAPNRNPCVVLWSLMVIFADGKVPMCNVDYNNKHPVGDVSDSSIKELWQGFTQNYRRGLHLRGERNAMDMCRDCTVWNEVAT
jgi:hypothetical protein